MTKDTHCCICNIKLVDAVIYIRINPNSVPYPEDDSWSQPICLNDYNITVKGSITNG